MCQQLTFTKCWPIKLRQSGQYFTGRGINLWACVWQCKRFMYRFLVVIVFRLDVTFSHTVLVCSIPKQAKKKNISNNIMWCVVIKNNMLVVEIAIDIINSNIGTRIGLSKGKFLVIQYQCLNWFIYLIHESVIFKNLLESNILFFLRIEVGV